jgi:hypothetical protein
MIKKRGCRPIEFGGFAFALEWADEKAGFLVNLITQFVSSSSLKRPLSIFRVHFDTKGSELTVMQDNSCIYRGINHRLGLQQLLDTIIEEWIKLCTKGILLRGALVSRNGKGMIIIDRSDSEKTSLLVSLLLSEWLYHGDQLVLIADDTISCNSFINPIWLNVDWSLPFYGKPSSQHKFFDDTGQMIVTESIPILNDLISNQTVTPELLLVSQFKNGSPLSLNPIKLGLATFYFVESLLNNNIFKHEGIERVSKIIRSLHAYELFYGDLEQLSSLKLPFFESKEVEQP